MRCSLAMVLVALAMSIGASRADDIEKAEEKLTKARDAYSAAMAGIRKDVVKLIDDKDAAERKRANPDLGNLKALKAEKDALEQTGEVPKWIDAKIKDRIAKAHISLVAALTEAKAAYVRAKDDDKAAAFEKEIEQTKVGVTRPADAAKFGNKYFKVFDTNLTWHEAKKRCEQMGGRLAVIDSAEENKFVSELAAKFKVNAVWLGGTDEKNQRSWIWVDGQPVKYDNWDSASNQPNNGAGVEYYIVLFADKGGVWWDYPDEPKKYPRLTKPGIPGFVCQWK
jgi:Lectin C-type domain